MRAGSGALPPLQSLEASQDLPSGSSPRAAMLDLAGSLQEFASGSAVVGSGSSVVASDFAISAPKNRLQLQAAQPAPPPPMRLQTQVTKWYC